MKKVATYQVNIFDFQLLLWHITHWSLPFVGCWRWTETALNLPGIELLLEGPEQGLTLSHIYLKVLLARSPNFFKSLHYASTSTAVLFNEHLLLNNLKKPIFSHVLRWAQICPILPLNLTMFTFTFKELKISTSIHSNHLFPIISFNFDYDESHKFTCWSLIISTHNCFHY